MKLYSYRGEEPSTLPYRVRLDDGSTRTSLDKLSVEELESIGFVGPIVKPEFDENIQRLEWNGYSYEVIDLSLEEISRKSSEKELEEIRKKLENVDYNLFWELLISSSVYKKLRFASTQSLASNTLCTELVSLFGDAKAGKPNFRKIQDYINVLFLNFNFTVDEIEELKTIMNETNLSVRYSLPDEKYLSTYVYDIETNTVVERSPFSSWILVKGEWKAPIEYPNDRNVYNWNEEIGNWVKI